MKRVFAAILASAFVFLTAPVRLVLADGYSYSYSWTAKIYNELYTGGVSFDLQSSHAFKVMEERVLPPGECLQVSIQLTEAIKPETTATISVSAKVSGLQMTDADAHPNTTPLLHKADWKLPGKTVLAGTSADYSMAGTAKPSTLYFETYYNIANSLDNGNETPNGSATLVMVTIVPMAPGATATGGTQAGATTGVAATPPEEPTETVPTEAERTEPPWWDDQTSLTPMPEVVNSKLEDSGVHFSDLAGQVEVLFPIGLDKAGNEVYDEEDWHYAKLNMALPVGTKIKTYGKSRTILSFSDMTTFKQKPYTILIMPSASSKDNQWKILYGNIMANVKKMLKDGSMQVEMSQAVAGIKGTIFVLNDDGKTSTLKVLEGTVAFTAKSDGSSIMVSAGEMASADANGLGEKQSFDIAAENAQWADAAATQGGAAFPLGWVLGGCGALLIVIIAGVAWAVVKTKQIKQN
jgi:hypothetical protein